MCHFSKITFFSFKHNLCFHSIRNAMGEMWFSRLPYQIDFLDFVRLSPMVTKTKIIILFKKVSWFYIYIVYRIFSHFLLCASYGCFHPSFIFEVCKEWHTTKPKQYRCVFYSPRRLSLLQSHIILMNNSRIIIICWYCQQFL